MIKYDKKGLFLDLDGTIIETCSGNLFPKDGDDWKFKSGMLEQICRYYATGYTILIVSNQAGINKGHIRPLDFRRKTACIADNIDEYYRATRYKRVSVISEWFVSYYKDCIARKPSYIFARMAASTHKLDLSSSLMVGDASGKEIIVEGVPQKYKSLLDKGDEVTSEKEGGYRRIEKKTITYELLFAKDGSRTYQTIKKDFSDSDLMFAKNSGMHYLDVEEFLVTSPNEFANIAAAAHSDLNEIPVAKDCLI